MQSLRQKNARNRLFLNSGSRRRLRGLLLPFGNFVLQPDVFGDVEAQVSSAACGDRQADCIDPAEVRGGCVDKKTADPAEDHAVLHAEIVFLGPSFYVFLKLPVGEEDQAEACHKTQEYECQCVKHGQEVRFENTVADNDNCGCGHSDGIEDPGKCMIAEIRSLFHDKNSFHCTNWYRYDSTIEKKKQQKAAKVRGNGKETVEKRRDRCYTRR